VSLWRFWRSGCIEGEGLGDIVGVCAGVVVVLMGGRISGIDLVGNRSRNILRTSAMVSYLG